MLLLLACTSPNPVTQSDLIQPRPDREPPILDTGLPYPDDSSGGDNGTDTGDSTPVVAEPPRVVLNEVMSNNASYADGWGDLSDWIEIYNASTETVPYEQLMLTDSSGQIWMGSDGELAPGGFLIIIANSGATRTGAPFSLDADGEEITLLVNGQVTDRLATGRLDKDIVWGRYPDGGDWFPSAWVTKGDTNGDAPSDTLQTTPFRPGYVYDVNLILDAASDQHLQNYNTARTYTEAAVEIDGLEVDPVGVRLAGSYTYRSYPGQNARFKIDFNRYEDLRYRGIQKVNLLNMMAYSSGIKEYSLYEIGGYVGVPSVRNSFADLSVNGQPYAFYLFSETYDDNFLKYWYGSDDGGMIWEPQYGDINGSYGYWECKSGACDLSVVQRVSDILNGSANETTYAELQRYLNMDSALKMMILETMGGDWDGYCASHNYYVLYSPITDQIELAPSSLDLTFYGSTPSMTGCNQSIMRFCNQVQSCQDQYANALIEMADGIEEYGMYEHLLALRPVLEPYITSQAKNVISQSQFDAEYDQMLTYWQALPDYLRSQ